MMRPKKMTLVMALLSDRDGILLSKEVYAGGYDELSELLGLARAPKKFEVKGLHHISIDSIVFCKHV